MFEILGIALIVIVILLVIGVGGRIGGAARGRLNFFERFVDPYPSECLSGCKWISAGRQGGSQCLATAQTTACDREFTPEDTCFSCPKCRAIYAIDESKGELSYHKCVNADEFDGDQEAQDNYKSLNYCWAPNKATEQAIAANWRQPPNSLFRCQGPGPTLQKLNDEVIIDKDTGVPTYTNMKNELSSYWAQGSQLWEGFEASAQGVQNKIVDSRVTNEVLERRKREIAQSVAANTLLPAASQPGINPGTQTFERCVNALKTCQNSNKFVQAIHDPSMSMTSFNCNPDPTAPDLVKHAMGRQPGAQSCEQIAIAEAKLSTRPDHHRHPDTTEYGLKAGYKGAIGYVAPPGTKLFGSAERQRSLCTNYQKCQDYLNGKRTDNIYNDYGGVINAEKHKNIKANCIKKKNKVKYSGAYTQSVSEAVPYYLSKDQLKSDAACIIDPVDCSSLEKGFGVEVVGAPGIGGDPCNLDPIKFV